MNKVDIDDYKQFINELQVAFGNYKPGMIKALEYQLHYNGNINYDILFEHITMNWKKTTPPLLADIVELAGKVNINIFRKNREKLISICEFCYYGIKMVKNSRGKLVPENLNSDRSKCPKKIVEISEENNLTCPECFNRPYIGLCYRIR